MQIGLTRRDIGRLVLLAWAIALAWLARRELAGNPSTAERVRRLEPGAQFFAVLAGDRQIGQLNRSVDTLVDGVRLTELLVLDLPDGDSTRQLARNLEIELTRSLRLRRMVRSVFGTGLAERLEASMETDSALTFRQFEANAPAAPRVRVEAGPDPVLPAVVPLRAAFGRRLDPGSQFELPLLDLATGLVRNELVRVTAESVFVFPDSAVWSADSGRWIPASMDTIRAYRLEHRISGSPTVTWVGEDGAVVSEDILGGYSLRRSAFEIIGTNYRQARRADPSGWRRAIPGMVSLASIRERPGGTAGPNRVELADGSGNPIERNPNPRSDRPDSLRLWLNRSWEVGPPNDAEVRLETERALQGAGSPMDSIRRLTAWVASRFPTDNSLRGFGTAMNTLQARRGNPDGKARLLVTLARTAGIPARVIRGVAVLPSGVFGHTWTELWAGRWIAADPTLGDVPASASLVAVGIGETSRPIDLVPVLASARFLPLRSPP